MILQKNFFAPEPQYVCDVCSEAVTNPICPLCLSVEIDAWLTLYPNLREDIMPRLSEFLKKIENKLNESTECIKCRNKRASVCPYCFTQNVLNELRRVN